MSILISCSGNLGELREKGIRVCVVCLSMVKHCKPSIYIMRGLFEFKGSQNDTEGRTVNGKGKSYYL
ncbi:hypothetical protein Ga0451573_002639 [Peptococcaceae bacterium DYL19]|nr:hypothetical protein [Phosphitispora fastidiosa]